MNLTKEQQRIISHSGGHARVSAVAGSGKTTTMVERIGHLLRRGATADKLLVLMFNRSARDSFAESMTRNLGGLGCPLPEVRTFHSLGLRLVNSFTKRGALPAFRLVTEEYHLERLARQVVGEIYKEENEGWPSGEEVEEFLTFLDLAKGTVLGVGEVLAGSGLPARYGYFVRAFDLFERVRREQKIRFYADLIHEPLMAMRADPALAAWVADRVEHIIVDEYQDINEAQQQLLKILVGRRAKVMVVGDVDQCIYEWRGAQPEYITKRFQKDFPGPANYLLSYTFRYGHGLSLAANHLIANNRKRDRKFCVSHPVTPHTVISCIEEKDKFVGKQQGKLQHPVLTVISDWLGQGRTLAEAVVLVRLFAQSVPVELALLEAGIAYRLEGNNQVFDCPEILALTGYLQLVSGTLASDDLPARTATLLAMLAQPHMGLKREELEVLAQAIAENPSSAPQILSNWAGRELPPFLKKRFADTAENWRQLSRTPHSGMAAGLLKTITEKLKLYDFYDTFSARSSTAENRVKTCQAFIDFAAGQRLTVPDLLAKIAGFRAAGQGPAAGSLLITSVHRAKGLEWPLVILPGLEEGSFPFYREQGSETAELEDERRLFYVAMTRAIERLVFIHPADARFRRSIAKGCAKYPGLPSRVSRFLYEANPEISEDLGQVLHGRAPGKKRALGGADRGIAEAYLKAVGSSVELATPQKEQAQPERVADKILDIDDIAEGLRVWHGIFGTGTVLQVMDRKQGRVKVDFDDHGKTILLVGYAKLQPL
ncbi:MAG: ATP-dependent helicase [Proteobacteria bacterium]|nr:ATP-dependent helicase [Pseudomonadota bacterium]